MTLYHAERALLPDGRVVPAWMRVGDEGRFSEVSTTPLAGTPVPLHGLTVPGVTNLHSHAFQRALAGRAERARSGAVDSFWTWRETMYRFLATLDPDQVEAIATRLFVEMLEAGYTHVVEFHYLHKDPAGSPYADPHEMARRLVAAARRARIGLTLLPVIYDAGGFGGVDLLDGQRRFHMTTAEALELRGLLAREYEDIASGIALHSLRGVSPAALSSFHDARSQWSRAPVHIHISEQLREVEECLAWSGARPVEWLLDNVTVDADWCLVHATHLTEGELAGVVESGAVIGLCPTTEANLGDGIFPFSDHLRRGGRWGIGSDSHVSVDPVEELRWLEYVQRLARRERNVAAPRPGGSTGAALLVGAAEGGAGAAGRAGGALAAGRAADLVVLDPAAPAFAGHGSETLADAWLFSGNRSAVDRVMVAGRWVVEDGRHPESRSSLAGLREALAGFSF